MTQLEQRLTQVNFGIAFNPWSELYVHTKSLKSCKNAVARASKRPRRHKPHVLQIWTRLTSNAGARSHFN